MIDLTTFERNVLLDLVSDIYEGVNGHYQAILQDPLTPMLNQEGYTKHRLEVESELQKWHSIRRKLETP